MKSKIPFYSELAYQAMLKEVNLTPKPGLVDRYSNGAHKDMTLQHFYASANAIAPYFAQFINAGIATHSLNETDVLSHIRPIGIDCERAMLEATNNVNTHKGSIFSMGLITTAIGRLLALNQTLAPELICRTVAFFCHGIVKKELNHTNRQDTAGQRLFNKHGLTGARGEAESGFQTVITVSLPVYLELINKQFTDEQALHQALMYLMAENNDTNVVSRGGLDGLKWLQQRSRQLLKIGGISHPDYLTLLYELDRDCIIKNLSPGGCADLLIITWFLGQVTQNASN